MIWDGEWCCGSDGGGGGEDYGIGRFVVVGEVVGVGGNRVVYRGCGWV